MAWPPVRDPLVCLSGPASKAGSTIPLPIALQSMQPQDVIKGPEDDWTGLSSPAERRKAQNRLHQRAWRKRKAILRSQPYMASSSIFSNHAMSDTSSSPEVEAAGSIHSCSDMRMARWQDAALINIFNSAAGFYRIEDSERAQTATICSQVDLDSSRAIDLLRRWAQSCCILGSPGTDKLLVLVKLNVFRALISNSMTLGIAPEAVMDDDAVSVFSSTNPGADRILDRPLALRPTDLQSDVVHHPWIDCLPVPGMRQNIIRAGDNFDVMELCGDLVGLFSAGTGRTGMIVWGEPWDVAGWEVTEGFLKNWGWTIKGCWDIFESTNRWRTQRGERALCFDML